MRSVVGGALILFSAIAVGQVVLVVWGIIQTPYLACFAFLGLVTAMSYQMGSDISHRAELARQLQASETELHIPGAHRNCSKRCELGMWMWDIVVMKFGSRTKGAPCLASRRWKR